MSMSLKDPRGARYQCSLLFSILFILFQSTVHNFPHTFELDGCLIIKGFLEHWLIQPLSERDCVLFQ